MAYTIVKNYVSSSKYNKKCPYSMTPQYITVHNTANNASAKNEVSYMRNNSSSTSYHVAVDDKHVVLAVPFNRNAWHAGDGGSGTGNRKSIGIEICYSKSGGSKFDKAEANAAAYIATLLKERGWGISKVKRHRDWSGKDCPHRTIDYGWQRFLNMIQAELDELNGKKSTATTSTKKKSSTAAKKASTKLAVDGIWGTGTTRMTQKVLKSTVDGIVSNQPDDLKEYLEACSTSSWKFKNSSCKGGSAVVKKIQKLVGVTQDGFCGKKTVTAMQKFLNKKKFDCGKADGYLGEKTAKAWQKYINSRL